MIGMRLGFLDREEEQRRIRRALSRTESTLVCVYGRRRLGKSRLLTQILPAQNAIYFVGDQRDAALHRAALVREIARLIPGFDTVVYPSWDALLRRWWGEAPDGAVLVLDEFPYLVASAPELPSVLQALVDRSCDRARHTILCGSSQRMMLGLLLDASAPLYGRARELLRLEPLGPRWLRQALSLASDEDVVSHFAVWGGVPRYWELAAEYGDLWAAVGDLLLDPLGVLHREPGRLLLDDLREVARASSILALVGQGTCRVSEIGGRIGVPAPSLSRPIARLVELDLLRRETPWGAPPRRTKRSVYHVADPLLRFWYRFVDPNRSRLEAGQRGPVLADVRAAWPLHLGPVWEELARECVARREVLGTRWLPAGRWWGAGTDRRPLELDIVARSASDPGETLVGEVKLSATNRELPRLLAGLEEKAARCPALQGARVRVALWVLRRDGGRALPGVLTASDVLGP